MEIAFYIFLLVSIGFSYLIKYYWSRRKLYAFASKLPGPPTLPIVGNGLTFLGNSKEVLPIILDIIKKYPSPLRFWLGPKLVVIFSKPEQIEKLLTSSKLSSKHEIYEILKIYLGNGLVSGSGPKWRQHRKIIQPLLNSKFVNGNMHIYQKYANICIERLKVKEADVTFDLLKDLQNCFVDIIGETVLGTELFAQEGKNRDFIDDTTEMYTVGYYRLIKPWWHPNICYYFSSMKAIQDRIINTTTTFIQKVISQSRARIKLGTDSNDNEEGDAMLPIVDQISKYIIKNDGSINDEDFMYHMFTLYAASEDTITLISSALCVCLGMYPEYQQKAAEEVRLIFGETPKEIFYEDLLKLEYLDRCIKDVLRLFPIAAFIVRQSSEDVVVDEYTVPKGAGVMVAIMHLHRNPDYWEHPNQFYPDHFLPEYTQKRHPYAYIPFSAGMRSCIGKTLAMTTIRIMMVLILQNFEIEAKGKVADLKLTCDVSVRAADGYQISLKRRKWT